MTTRHRGQRHAGIASLDPPSSGPTAFAVTTQNEEGKTINLCA
jgi:hypothetical protein